MMELGTAAAVGAKTPHDGMSNVHGEPERHAHGMPAPFDELALGPDSIQVKARHIRDSGYCTIEMSPETVAYFRGRDVPDGPWQNKGDYRRIDLQDTDFAQKSTKTAAEMVRELSGAEILPWPREFEIRRSHPHNASTWHQDKNPTALVCLATLKGRGTQFVPVPEAGRQFATETHSIRMRPVDPDTLASHVQEAERGTFIVFAGRGIGDAAVPRLVHRAPGESDRSIFMARWKSANPQPDPLYDGPFEPQPAKTSTTWYPVL